MPKRPVAAVVVFLPLLVSCAHLVQPRTYTTNVAASERMQRDYLQKELVRSLPEEAFRRWYTRDGTWADPERPFIRKVRADGALTVYEVGSDQDAAGEVVFREGALDHWSRWRLVQESVVSSWMQETVDPPEVEDAALRRIAALDPQAEPPIAYPAASAARRCEFEAGNEVETLVPIVYDRESGNRLLRFAPRSQSDDPSGRFALLPAGTRLTIRRWNPVQGRRLTGADGVEYLVDAPLGLATFADVLCPAGQCVPEGGQAILTRDLEVAAPDAGGAGQGAALAVLPGTSRVPIWLRRAGTLEAGSAVTIRRWPACASMEAVIAPQGGGAIGLPGTLTVPLAPPGLFAPAAPDATTETRMRT
jgi:hypothetical protein